MQPWVEPDVWERASEPDPAAATVSVVVVDRELGSLAVVWTPDGQMLVGYDSGWDR